jgi:CheY-like chemotaxis protein
MNQIKNLALVDDDNMYVFLTKMMIQDSKLVEHVKEFKNGQDAINFLQENLDNTEHLPEVILLDLDMPIMDGWQFLEEFILLKPHIGKKIIIYIVSSSISPEDIKKAKTISEVSDYIIKPITKQNLEGILKQI